MAAPTLARAVGVFAPGVAPRSGKIKLPRSSSRLAIPRAFCRIVESVRYQGIQPHLDGPIYAPGAEVDALPDHGLVVECGGAAHPVKGHNRPEVLWILWKWDGARWQELSRAVSQNWEWLVILAPVIERNLQRNCATSDPAGRGVTVTSECLVLLERRLSTEPEAVRREVWRNLYDQLPGRLVA